MEQLEKVDVLLATYNGEKYLRKQIDSILNQTYKNINLIISDDCSKDKTKEILKEYEKKDNRIKIFYQEKNLGLINNFEFLLKKAESPLFMLADQDDVWLSNKIEQTFKKLKKDNADLVFTDLEIVDENLKILDLSFNRKMKKIHKIKKTIKTKQFEYLYNNITGCTIMCKTKWIKDILPIPKNSKYIIQDSWIGLIVSLNGKISYLDEPTIRYRQHGDNLVGTQKQSYKFEDFNQIRQLFIEVKKDLFKTYLENKEKFPDDLNKLTSMGKEYFDKIEQKENINFKGWNIFHKLYKNEQIGYYIINFIILNIPILGRVLFKIYSKTKKIILRKTKTNLKAKKIAKKIIG